MLKSRGTRIVAKIGGRNVNGKVTIACEDLARFASDIAGTRTKVGTFSGLGIVVKPYHQGRCGPHVEDVELISTNLMMKHLYFTNFGYAEDIADSNKRILKILNGRLRSTTKDYVTGYYHCTIWEHCKSILISTARQLEHVILEVGSMVFAPADMKIEGCEFPQLRTIEFQHHGYNNSLPRFLKTIVNNAASLVELRFEHSVEYSYGGMQLCVQRELDELTQVIEGSKAHVVYRKFPSLKLQMTELFVSHLKVRSLVISQDCHSVPPKEHYDRVKTVLRNSVNTLEFADVDVVLLLMALLDGDPFTKMNKLLAKINLDYIGSKPLDPLKDALLQRPDLWRRCFPNLKRIELEEPDNDGHDDKPAPGITKELLQQLLHQSHKKCPTQAMMEGYDTLLQVQWLRLGSHSHGGIRTPAILDLLANLCPLLKFLDVAIRVAFPPDLWSRWSYLEEISFTLLPPLTLDSVFCGIHAEEATELKGKSVEYLKSVHIVPVRPSLAHLTSKLLMLWEIVPSLANACF